MNSAMLTVIVHGLLAIGLVIGGILALRYGFVLFREGPGTGRSAATISFGRAFKATANSVGAVLMITAVGWGFLAVTALPNYKSPQEQVAYIFNTPSGVVKAPELSLAGAAWTAAHGKGELLGHFREVLNDANRRGHLAPAISGQVGTFDSAKAYVRNVSGKITFEAPVQAGADSAALTYRAITRDGITVFRPEAAEVTSAAAENKSPTENPKGDDHTG